MGERAFFIGNGPSLIDQDLRGLVSEITFTCNQISLWDEMPFTPSYHCIDEYNLPGNAIHCDNSEWDCARFFISRSEYIIPNWTWIPKANKVEKRSAYISHDGFLGLEGDALLPLHTGMTTPLTVAQLGAYMGIREFYFLGIDLSNGYCYAPNSHREISIQPRSKKQIQQNFSKARDDLRSHGKKVFDCNPQSGLTDILPYRLLEEVLEL